MAPHLLRASGRLTSRVALIVTMGACSANRADDPAATIVVDGYLNHEAVHAFEKAQGRHSTREELLAIHGVWLDNEVLYREGLKLTGPGPADRESVISNARKAIDERLRSSPVTDEDLRRWFDGHRDRFDQPARFDFEDAALPAQSSEAAAHVVVEKLNGGAPGDAPIDLRAFKGRPEANLVQSYGQEVASALEKATRGTWLAVHARDGWRAMRLIASTPGKPAVFEAQHEAIHRDWLDAAIAEKRVAVVLALRQTYKIAFAETHDCAADR